MERRLIADLLLEIRYLKACLQCGEKLGEQEEKKIKELVDNTELYLKGDANGNF